jgi:hypothetical protein
VTRATLFVVSALVLALMSAPVRADDAEQARFHDALAREHYAAGRYEQAIREFFHEQRLAPNPRVQFNIALCFDQLHRDDDAYSFFREYLAEGDEDAARRQQAESALARLEPRVARVSVTTDPPGATIYVDARDHGSYGVAPRVLVLAPGRHTLTLELAGHVALSREIEAIRGQEVALEAALVRITGTLEVRSSVPGRLVVRDAGGTSVFEGDLAAGEAPLTAVLAPGDYELALSADGHEEWRGLARVRASETVRTAATPAVLPAPTGDVTVTASAAGALIEVDGEAAGFAPSIIDGLRTGTHEVQVSHPGLQPWRGEITIAEDTRSWLTVSLVPPSETTRSPSTWVVGGVGLATVVVGAVLGGLALSLRDRFASLEAQQSAFAMGMGEEPMGSLADLRDQQVVLSTASDVLFAIGGAALIGSIVLFFATEETETRRSEGTFSEGDR